ncbi:MAG: saccharopine dehydrogenase NADP-binding domain-containing protein [Verrucomicrobia bacterium]|nr:saccharopine dehydrogenase NADP-binding domain-containing protein [Verrucomicrobiota bacterium]
MKAGIIGAGKIGTSIAELLEAADFCTGISLADVRPAELPPAAGKTTWHRLDVTLPDELDRFVASCDAVVSATPFYLNRIIAKACARAGRSYFDLTEDVETTGFVRRLAEGQAATFMPQCGLAPGAVNIIGSGLASSFRTVRALEMRVGALPLSAGNQMKYYLSWSTAGLINEYCRMGEALYQGRRIDTIPLDGVERLTIDGVEYEAFNTSGGVATMCETFAGRVSDLSYKTLRYPGHRDLLKFLLFDLNLSQKQDLLTQIFDQEVPLTFNDVVVLYVNSIGTDGVGPLQRSFVKKIYAGRIGGRSLSAIQLATAAGVAAVLELFAAGHLPSGFVRQEAIRLDAFLSTQWGGRVYGHAETVAPKFTVTD